MTFTLSMTLADFLRLCPGMLKQSGGDCFNREMKMSSIAQDFDNLNIITVLEGRTQAVIRNHFLRYDRAVRCRVKIITMDMFSPYYDLAKQLRFRISRLMLKQSTGLFHFLMQKLYLIAFTLYNI